MYDNIQILVEGIVATGDQAFQVGTAPQTVNLPNSQDIILTDDDEHRSTDEVCY
jgi:hypothetical protein